MRLSGREVCWGRVEARVVVKVMARSIVVSSWRAILFCVMC